MTRFPAAARAAADRLLRPLRPLVRAANLWSGAGGMRMAAAMSFYGMLSLAPLLLVMVAMLGWWVDRQTLQQTLVHQADAVVGAQGAAVIQQALASAREPGQGLLATVVGFGVLLFGATGVFGELQESFARVWSDGGPPPRPSWWHSASLRLRGVAYILVFGFLLLVSLVLSTVLAVAAGWAGDRAALEAVLRVLNELASFGLCAALFVALMRLSGGPKPGLRFLVLGGVVGAILFTVGRQLLTFYLSTAAVVSAYGAAGSLVVLLIWMYFSGAVLLFSAGCAKAAEEARAERAARAAPAAAGPAYAR
ncbi:MULTISPECIES: YihY/virulence factor BrkB family protein [Ramlibacter]|uniref:YihY family inner membrane protein n=1 Tax=Ramlibacter pinisoli TaxID=2682844 RepID=A0A6N8INU0_9BURK|nr:MULTISPECIES: YihY/virulence factor BrkB family protein [Ramlibacter]MBA2960650.1 YihY/virulence factor BrkB family protein [Ramlibacter sp. CGMCC 1.13660]MVQ27980.1 YihY family inner membrane protein [Ramlibacter pinisoli]